MLQQWNGILTWDKKRKRSISTSTSNSSLGGVGLALLRADLTIKYGSCQRLPANVCPSLHFYESYWPLIGSKCLLFRPRRNVQIHDLFPGSLQRYPTKMDLEINGTRPLDYMILKFLSLADHPASKMRSHAVAYLSYFVLVNCQSFWVHLNAFIACLFKRAPDEDLILSVVT